jgi:hypothetical protein
MRKTLVTNAWFLICQIVFPCLAQDHCRYWQSKVDSTIKMQYPQFVPSQLSEEETLEAMECLLALEGQKGPASIGGVTRPDVSQILPPVSIEIGALFYISYLYTGKWDGFASGITLVDKGGKWNRPEAVAKAFHYYREWFSQVKSLGLAAVKEKRLSPLDGRDVRWY